MRLPSLKIYDLYHEFINICILNGNSLFTDDTDIFTIANANEVIRRFIGNFMKSDERFEQKIRVQFDGADRKVLLFLAHANWVWAMAPDDITPWRKQQVVKEVMNDPNIALNLDKFPSQGFGSAGQWHRQNKYKENRFVILLIKQLLLEKQDGRLSTQQEADAVVEKICLKLKYGQSPDNEWIDEAIWKDMPDGKLAMCNILLHLCCPDSYEPIASDNHKSRIVATFQSLIAEAPEGGAELNTDQRILAIRHKIAEYWHNPGFSFYDDKLTEIWDYDSGISDFDPYQAIQFKKALIFYGPPGTSKTYSAGRLAANLIYQYYFRKPDNVRSYFVDKLDIKTERIHHLQLHPNYSYEDFIGGTQFINGDTVKQEGYLLQLLDKIRKDEFPNVLILDEINRVDLSKLFGELFSALENRGKEITTSIGNFIINVPSNLYVIGTMNEIDFSLERIDFALRRRFVWFFFGYDQDILREMLRSKRDAIVKCNIKNEEIDEFVSKCTELNAAVEKMEELGRQYEIGHTFFAEVVDIHESFKHIGSNPRLRLLKRDGPVKVLWDISIKPMLEAFLGNMDKEAKDEHIQNLSKLFLPQ